MQEWEAFECILRILMFTSGLVSCGVLVLGLWGLSGRMGLLSGDAWQDRNASVLGAGRYSMDRKGGRFSQQLEHFDDVILLENWCRWKAWRLDTFFLCPNTLPSPHPHFLEASKSLKTQVKLRREASQALN